MRRVVSPASAGVADILPVGGAVTAAQVAAAVDECLQEYRRLAVARLPVARQMALAAREHLRGEFRDTHAGAAQKSGYCTPPAVRCRGEQILVLYRRRGKAEAHMGEFKDVVGDSQLCTSRGAAAPATVLARSQALLALRLLANELMHVLRAHMEAATQRGLESARRARAPPPGRPPGCSTTPAAWWSSSSAAPRRSAVAGTAQAAHTAQARAWITRRSTP